jgi:long-subunit fatty acid transport protein
MKPLHTIAVSTAIALALAARQAHAIDARAVAMGNTGAAYVDDGAAIYYNPALIHQTPTFATTVSLAAVSAVLNTPIAGPNTQFASSSSPFPLFLLGTNYRLSDRIVVGIALYPTAGFGAKYERVLDGQDVTLTAVSVEAAPTASFALTEDLAIAVGYRATYTMLETGTPLLSTYEKQEVSGTSLLGAQAGIFHRPTRALRWGFAYRSKISTSLSGTTTFNGMTIPTTSSIAWPHMFRAGAAYSLFDDALLLALDASYAVYSDATQELAITESYATGPKTTSATLGWIDAFGAGVGAEYRVRPYLPVRVGYGITRSRTAPDLASYFFSPPGVLHSFHAGAGVRLDRWEIDMGAYYEGAARDIATSRIANPGRYAIHGVAGALSVSFRM